MLIIKTKKELRNKLSKNVQDLWKKKTMDFLKGCTNVECMEKQFIFLK